MMHFFRGNPERYPGGEFAFEIVCQDKPIREGNTFEWIKQTTYKRDEVTCPVCIADMYSKRTYEAEIKWRDELIDIHAKMFVEYGRLLERLR